MQTLLLLGEVSFLKSQEGKNGKTWDDTAWALDDLGRRARTLEAHIGLLKQKLDLLKRVNLPVCEIEVVYCKGSRRPVQREQISTFLALGNVLNRTPASTISSIFLLSGSP